MSTNDKFAATISIVDKILTEMASDQPAFSYSFRVDPAERQIRSEAFFLTVPTARRRNRRKPGEQEPAV